MRGFLFLRGKVEFVDLMLFQGTVGLEARACIRSPKLCFFSDNNMLGEVKAMLCNYMQMFCNYLDHYIFSWAM